MQNSLFFSRRYVVVVVESYMMITKNHQISINGHIYIEILSDDIFCSLNYTNENRWQSPEKATRDESRAQICAGDWWRQEAAQIPPGDRRVERNPKVPKVHGIAHPKVAVSTLGERNRARFQD